MFKNILKFGFAAALITWLVQSGKIDFSLIPKSLDYPESWLMALFLLLMNVLLTSFRWRWLLMSDNVTKISVFNTVRLTWIGLFFNTVLPGAVTGDLIKVFYAKNKMNHLTKSGLLGTALIDRILGVVGLVFLMTITTFISYDTLMSYPKIQSAIYMNYFLFAGVLVFFISLFLPRKIQQKLIGIIQMVPKIGSKLVDLVEHVWKIGQNKRIVTMAVGLTLFSQTLNISAFYFLAKPFLPADISPILLFTFVPIGLVCTAIPISPAGLGVGHAAFDALFLLFNIKGGADFFNFYYIAMTIMNLFGFIPYILEGKKIDLKNLEKASQ